MSTALDEYKQLQSTLLTKRESMITELRTRLREMTQERSEIETALKELGSTTLGRPRRTRKSTTKKGGQAIEQIPGNP